MLSGFTANNIGGLFVTAGFVTGFGNCFRFMVCPVVPYRYLVPGSVLRRVSSRLMLVLEVPHSALHWTQ